MKPTITTQTITGNRVKAKLHSRPMETRNEKWTRGTQPVKDLKTLKKILGAARRSQGLTNESVRRERNPENGR